MIIGGYNFTEPAPLANFSTISNAGIYAILGLNLNGNYTAIYIGESGDLGARIDSSHHKYYTWLQYYPLNSLYISVLWTPSNIYTKEQRKALEASLISLYTPVCNG